MVKAKLCVTKFEVNLRMIIHCTGHLLGWQNRLVDQVVNSFSTIHQSCSGASLQVVMSIVAAELSQYSLFLAGLFIEPGVSVMI